MRPGPNCPNRLLVEGKDDKFAVIGLLARHGQDWETREGPYVSECGGIDSLLSTLRVALKSYTKLGAIIDADLSLKNRWAQLRSAVQDTGLKIPKNPVAGGLVIEGTRPNTKVGLWLMPDNKSPGKLEDFLSKLIPDNMNSIWELACTSTAEAIKSGAGLKQVDTVKGAVHAYLAWQESPGLPFGSALTAQFLKHEGPQVNEFVVWFRRLFSDEFVEKTPKS